jgi:uncharacterized protein DUF1566
MSLDTISSVARRTAGILVGMLLISVPAVGLPSDPGIDVQAHASRFQILEGYKGEAVLDTETHLIWERTPSSAETAWANASLRCALTSTGGRLGWRLPSFLELMTLVEPAPPAAATRPSLPASHPFRGVRADPYWTTSSQDTDPTNAYAIDFLRGDVTPQPKNRSHAWWCVRGGASNAPPASARVRPQQSI